MNLLEHTITDILSVPRKFNNKHWIVKIEYDCYGNKGVEDHLCRTKDEARNLKIGDIFLA